MKNLKTRVAATATIIGLGGLTGVALSSGGQSTSSLASKPLVRTKVIHRTVRVTKHLKPRHPVAAGTPGRASGAAIATGASSGGSGAGSPGAAPVSTSASGTSTPSYSGGPAPVVTQTSGSSAGSGGSGGGTTTPVTTGPSGTGSAAGGGGGEDSGEAEHEGGGDD